MRTKACDATRLGDSYIFHDLLRLRGTNAGKRAEQGAHTELANNLVFFGHSDNLGQLNLAILEIAFEFCAALASCRGLLECGGALLGRQVWQCHDELLLLYFLRYTCVYAHL